ncbi:2Fe-2S iron-sulfur cluster-binding protein [Streptomyces sp. NPDC086787]|uniref:2Fe-2S iron-sulfur cluster-binding protein n=1 Tax=Streptomyces sp. NPDC086787 TaxID=3365759 RepID=UPI00381AA69E
MTDDQHAEGSSQGGGRWDPLPQGDYDDGATAFVKLPEGGIDALLAADSPLAAPGHGYVPPQIAVVPGANGVTDPAATGSWAIPADDGTRWPDPNAVRHEPGHDDRFAYHPGATQQWTFEEPAEAAAPGHDVTGEWSIPVAGGDLPDESGEFTTSALIEHWGGTPPATLPGGAPAPWATEGAGATWGQQATDPRADGPRADAGHPEEGAPAHPDAAPPYRPAEEHAPAAPEPADAAFEGPAEHLARPDADDTDGTGDTDHTGGTDAEDTRPETAAGTAVDDESDGPAAPEEMADEAPDEAAPGPDDQGEADDTPDTPEEQAPLPPHEEHPLASYVLRVNGADRPVTDAWIGESLLYVLRERLGLAGAKDGCSQGECGACNVQVDGRLVASCLVPAVTSAGSEVRTVEGLAADGQPSDVQRALARCGAVQCGFCVPGMAMTVHDLLEGNPAPTEIETRQALCGNLCRCTGYRGVLEAVKDVVAEREAHAEAEAEGGTDTGEVRIPHQAGPGAGGVSPSLFEASGFEAPGPQIPRDPQPPYEQPYEQPYGQDGGQA